VGGRRGGIQDQISDECIKETTPFIIVRLDKIKNNRNMGFDVYCLEDSSGWRSDGRSVVLDGGCIRGIGVETGQVNAEEGVVFQVRHGRRSIDGGGAVEIGSSGCGG
jgi:hypothetical protein